MKWIFALLSFCSFAFALAGIDTNVDGFHLTIHAEDPQYQMWLNSRPEEIYSFQLQRLYELVDGKMVGPVTVPHRWIFSPIVTTHKGVSFNMTYETQLEDPFHLLQFRNRIDFKNNTKSACPGIVCIKYDVVISNYKWTDPKSELVMLYRYTSTNATEPCPVTGNKVSVGESWLMIDETATAIRADGRKSDVPARIELDDSGVHVIYKHFNDTLVHDPLLGIGQPEAYLGVVVALSIIGALLVIGALVGGILCFTTKKPGYAPVPTE